MNPIEIIGYCALALLFAAMFKAHESSMKRLKLQVEINKQNQKITEQNLKIVEANLKIKVIDMEIIRHESRRK